MDWIWVLITGLRAVSPAAEDRWAATLAELDGVRAEAYATADSALLDGVYVEGSAARRADTETIARYEGRGGRVVGAELRIISCRVLASSASRARLDVVDRLGPARVVWSDGRSEALPRDEPSRRVITLVRTAEGWRIAEIGSRAPSRR